MAGRPEGGAVPPNLSSPASFATACGRQQKADDRRSTLPLSVLPDISPTRGEIGSSPPHQPCEVSHLSSRADLGLAVEVQNQAGLGKQRRGAANFVADQVFHDAVGMARGAAERQAANSA